MQPLLRNILTLVVIIVFVSEGQIDAVRSLEELYGTCDNDEGCLLSHKCVNKRCQCRDGLVGDAYSCKIADPPSCKTSKDCHKKAACVEGKCRCMGYFIGDGKRCLATKSVNCMTKDYCGDKGTCLFHPLRPDFAVCKCWIGYVFNDKQLCVAPNIPCTDDKDCSSKAKCEHGLCVCQGNRVGNGRECRDAKVCKGKCNTKKTKGIKCLVDPMMPEEKVCKCPPNQVHAAGNSQRCVPCMTDKQCKGNERCEDFECKKPDLHPCDSSEDCDRNAECRDKKCHCREKYAGNGRNCSESLPCPVAHECDANSECILHHRHHFSPYCRCKFNFKKADNGACIDIDECKDPNACPAKQKCINTPGAYECHCEEGYEKGDGDECVKMKCKCGAHGSKCDEDGKCTCNEGYEKNGEGVCTECKCASHEECFNGKCRCKTGYKKNSKGMCARKRSARQVDSGHSVHVTSHLGTLGLVLTLLGRLAVTA
ncbi:tenascin-like [Pocillopora verrucosa]|uniref:tenascin-like n=1 Tax=Pocillopora verrucosa TaxID=203993 RepID=UPI00333F618C